jgi:hypothetical protein
LRPFTETKVCFSKFPVKREQRLKTFEEFQSVPALDRFSERKQMINFELNDFDQDATFSVGVA